MTTTVTAAKIKDAVKLLFAETFDEANGVYLDKGDSLWSTLENVTAEQASIPIAPGGNSIAGQVSHMIYYFEVSAMFMRGEEPDNVNWGAAWQTVAVDEGEWKGLRRELGEWQARILEIIDTTPEEIFADPNVLGGSYGIVAHSAFHLGQIKHALAAQGM